MLNELNRSIAITQQILAVLGNAPSALSYPPNSQTVQAIFDVSTSGIRKITNSRIPASLSTELYKATQSHFKQSCLALQRTHSQRDPHVVQRLASKLQSTYTAMYERKVADVASRIAQMMPQKQPYATDVLLYAFEQTQSPSRRERDQLASLTGLTTDQVRVWFQNRRQRMKKRAPELQARAGLQLDDVLARVAAYRKAADEDFEDDDSGYCSASDREHSSTPSPRAITSLTSLSTTPRSYPAPYTPRPLSSEFHCEPPVFRRTAALHPPVHVQTTTAAELVRLMSRLTLRHRRQTARPSTSNTIPPVTATIANKPPVKGGKAANAGKPTSPNSDARARRPAVRKDPETGRKVAGRRTASATTTASSPLSAPSPTAYPPTASSSPPPTTDSSAKPRKRLGPLRRKPAGKALARQASESSVGSTSSSDSSRSTSYSSDFSLASDSSFTSVESAPTAATMECFQPQQPLQFDPLAAFDFTQLFSSQPSDPLPQPVADFELPPDLLAGLQMPMDTAALPAPESTDFLALLNDPTIQDLLQSVQDMDVVAPQQVQESLTFNNTFDVGSVDTSAFLDLNASTLSTFDAMFGLDASSFQDTLWNSPGFSLPITA